MIRDRDYFQRRAAEARAAALNTGGEESAEVAGHLALAYAALARRRVLADSEQETPPAVLVD